MSVVIPTLALLTNIIIAWCLKQLSNICLPLLMSNTGDFAVSNVGWL